MYKLMVLPLLFAAVSAGYLGAPAVATYAAAPAVSYAAPALAAYGAPAVVAAHAPVVAAPAAVSYANTYKAPPARLAYSAYAAPAVAYAAPVAAYAAPAIVKSHVAGPAFAYGLH